MMKISNSNEITNYINKSTVAETKKATEEPVQRQVGQQEPHSEGAIVEISQRSKDVHKAQSRIQAEPDTRPDKVEAIKQRIERGEYEIDYEGTAEKMLKAFFDDMV